MKINKKYHRIKMQKFRRPLQIDYMRDSSISMYQSIDGTSFHTNWRCRLHNQVVRHNGRRAIQNNIKLLKESPEKVGGDKEMAKELIELLEGISDDQAWIVANAMAGLSIEKALETLNSISG